jgi:hypothetical protein
MWGLFTLQEISCPRDVIWITHTVPNNISMECLRTSKCRPFLTSSDVRTDVHNGLSWDIYGTFVRISARTSTECLADISADVGAGIHRMPISMVFVHIRGASNGRPLIYTFPGLPSRSSLALLYLTYL